MRKRIDWDSQIGRRLKLRDLHAFVAVAEQASMAKAAAKLGVSQPAISKVIADLEHALGIRLFDRSRSGVQPTVYGQALLRRGRAAFDELRQGVREIEFLSDSTKGEVRIACPESVISTILPQLVERFSEDFSRVSLVIDSIVSPSIGLPLLRDRKCDLVIGWLPRPLPREFAEEDLEVETVAEDRLVVAVGSRSRWSRRRVVELKDLMHERWIMQAGHTWNYTRLAEAFRARGLEPPEPKLVTLSIPLRIHFLRSSTYISALPRSITRRNGLRELPLKLPTWDFPLSVITLKHRLLPPVALRLLDSIRDACR